MKISIEVKVSNTTERSDLYTLFIGAAKGDFIDETKGRGIGHVADVDKLESLISKKFDEFAQKYFDEGRKFEKEG